MKIRSCTLTAGAIALSLLGTAPAAPASAQAFGEAVALGDGELYVGAASSEREPGMVYVYEAGASGWREVDRLTEYTHREDFGSAIAVTGEHLFIGAPGAEDGGVVLVYERAEGGGWELGSRLSATGASGLGRSIAADGGRLLVLGTDAANEGPVVFAWERNDEGSWGIVDRLVPPDPSAEIGFGAAITLEGDLAVVGAPADGDRGAVFVFHDEAGEGWRSLGRLPPPADLPERARFGAAVAVTGGEILIGAPGADGGRGAIHRYAGDPATGWSFARTLAPPEDGTMAFGAGIAVAGASALVGAPAARGGWGGAYPMRRGDEGWHVGDAIEVEAAQRTFAGGILAIGGGAGVIGVPGDDFGAGSVFALSGEGDRWASGERLAPEQVGLPAIAGGQVDCEEGSAEGYGCEEVDLLAFVPREELGAGRGARLNDVWGWTDPDTGREYAIVGRMDGTAFVDVTDPHNPRYLGNLDKTEGSQSNTWRDMKVFDGYVFVVADGAGEHGMQVFDLTRLREVTAPVEFEATALYDGVASSHNIIINEETGFAYLVGASGGGETCGGGLHMVDINDPLNPVFAGCFAHPNTGRRGTGGSHDAQCVVYHGPDEDYAGREICMNSNETALSIADVTDKDHPVAVAQAAYPNVGYAHQGWLTDDHRYFYSNDELDEVGGLVEQTRTLVWDVSDLDDPTLVREYYSPTKVTDHNMYVKGDRLYMSNNRSGLRVVDIGDPENPVEIGHFDTTPWSDDEAGFDGTWSVYPYFESGTILLSSRREGLFLVKPREQRLVP